MRPHPVYAETFIKLFSPVYIKKIHIGVTTLIVTPMQSPNADVLQQPPVGFTPGQFNLVTH